MNKALIDFPFKWRFSKLNYPPVCIEQASNQTATVTGCTIKKKRRGNDTLGTPANAQHQAHRCNIDWWLICVRLLL